MAIYALLWRADLQQIINVKDAGLLNEPFDSDRPRTRDEPFGLSSHFALVGGELVEIVIVGDVFIGGLFLVQRWSYRRGSLDVGNLFSGLRLGALTREAAIDQSGAGRGRCKNAPAYEQAPRKVQILIGDLTAFDVFGFLDQHNCINSSTDEA